MSQVDRISGLVGNLGAKAPCNCATTTAITAFGPQVIDGYACTSADNGGMGTRVLRKDEPNPVDNGIYYCNDSAWQRAPDFDGDRDVAQGTLIVVYGGTVNAKVVFRVTTPNPVNIGVSACTFEVGGFSDANNLTFLQAGAGATARTMRSKEREVVSVKDFGAVGDGVVDDTAAIQAAIDYATPLGFRVFLPRGVYNVNNTGLLTTNAGIGNTGGDYPIYYFLGVTGDGAANTILNFTGTTGTCLTIRVGGPLGAKYEGFSVLQKTGHTGKGIQIDQSANVYLQDIAIDGFSIGLYLTDSFSLGVSNVVIYYCGEGIRALTLASISHPNDITFLQCNIRHCTTRAAYIQNPTTVRFIGGSLELNGDGAASSGGILVDGNPLDGASGVTVTGMYIEGNYGGFDVRINDGSTTGIHSITGCTFNRVGNVAFTTANIAFYSTNAVKTVIVVDACAFKGFGAYVPNAGRMYVQAPTPTSTNFRIELKTNLFDSATETPSFNEGAWNPVFTGFTFGGSTNATATFTRKDRLIFFTIHVVDTVSINATMGGGVYITGLPNNPSVSSVCSAVYENVAPLGNGLIYTSGRIYPPTIAAGAGVAVTISGSYIM